MEELEKKRTNTTNFYSFFPGPSFSTSHFLAVKNVKTHLFSKRQQQCWKPQNVLTEILQYSLSWSYSKWDMGKNPQVFSAKPQPNLDTHTNFPSKITFQSLFCVNTELMVSHPNSSDGFDENPNQDFFWTLEIEVKMVRLWLLWEKLLMRIFFSWREARSSDHICSPQILLEKKLIRDVGIFFGKTKTINKMMMPW